MEIDKITFIKILHYTVENFIKCVKSYFSLEVLDTKKVFREIIKRCELITQRLRAIALHAKTSLENSVIGLSDVKQFLDDRIQKLVHNIILQDFIEFAFNGDDDDLNISEGELHNFLYCGAMRDITSFTPSTVEMGGLSNFHMPLYESVNTVTPVSTFDNNLNCLLLSSQFENSRIQFEDELTELRRISESGFLVSDLNRFNVATILKYENSDAATKTNPKKNEFKGFHDPFAQNNFMDPSISVSPDSDLGILSDISESSDSFLCWEDCLGKFQHDHSYISEVTPEAALSSISEKEYHIYYSIINPNDAISEEYMVHDILDLLIGVPSNTFYYDIHARRFKMKYGVHLPNLSSECTAKVVANFIEAGSIYYALQRFSKDFVHSSEGLVFKGMQHGIQLILSMYKEYVIAVKVNCPTMLFLQSDVLKNAELLMSFGVNCGIDPEKMIFCDIPKGLGLLSYLHDIARSHRRKENGIMIAVLLKYSYEPYFSYLNEWMTEGVCNDPYGEFQIMEDFNYLNRRDALYWKFAYTENIDDPTRVVPPEIKHYSQGILDCGKSIGMLKICCPELSSLKFLTCEAIPSLSMVYSFPGAIQKLKDCMDYTRLEENCDMVASLTASDVSADQFLVESQNFVDKETMFRLMKRRCNLILAGMITGSNVLDFKKMFHHIKNYQTNSDEKNKPLIFSNKCSCIPVSVCDGAVLKGCLFRNVGPLFSSYNLKCLDSNFSSDSNSQQYPVHILSSSKEDNFSGKLYSKVGTLFSSCGYIERDLSDSLSKEIELNFTSLDFGQQLRLLSYNQLPCLPVTEECKQMFASEIQYVTKFDKCGLLWQMKNCSSIRQSESCYSKNQDKGVEDDLPVPISIHSRNLGGLGNAYIADSCNNKNNIVLNSFMDKLASLLISEYEDTVDDIYSCIQVTSLQRLMMHNFNAVLKMRIHLTEKVIMKYIVKQLGLDLLLSTLRDIYFFQDETFNQALCEPLFSLVMKCRTPREFANWAVLNEILMNAVVSSKFENSPFAASINANIAYIPEDMPIERTDFLHLFVIEFEVKWPLNIIVHQACLQQYLKIFSVLLEIEFLCWMLGRIWRKLTITCKNLHLDDAPQFRQVMLKRFDMDQFIRVIRNSIHQHLQGPLWEYLTKNLSAEESSIDTLENIHMQYLEKALARCFLTDETNVLHQLLFTMCHQIYKFCSAISECAWEKNEETGQYETYVFKGLSAAFDTYKQYQKVFLKLWLQNTLMVDRYNEGDINKKVWTLLGQRLSGFPGDSFRDRKKY